ncbi:MAG: hypothetical protein E6Q97_20610 [Desulfurellales bacterium]|nr:MAG: hypothetical protein E6Q97_20610 [Desulfurellales bacterium]
MSRHSSEVGSDSSAHEEAIFNGTDWRKYSMIDPTYSGLAPVFDASSTESSGRVSPSRLAHSSKG